MERPGSYGRAVVSGWEKGRSEPEFIVLYHIAQILQVRMEWLATGQGRVSSLPPKLSPELLDTAMDPDLLESFQVPGEAVDAPAHITLDLTGKEVIALELRLERLPGERVQLTLRPSGVKDAVDPGEGLAGAAGS